VEIIAQAEPKRQLRCFPCVTQWERFMAGTREEGSTQRRQHRQQAQQQQAQQSEYPTGPGLPDKQHQTKHNTVSESLKGRFSSSDQ